MEEMTKLTNEELEALRVLRPGLLALESQNVAMKKYYEAELDRAVRWERRAEHKIESLEQQLQQLQDDYRKLEHAIGECGGECHHALEE